jgi:hypothetical protein
MIRTALALRMERSFVKRVVLLVVLVAAIGGTCVVKAGGEPEPCEDRRPVAKT